MKQHVWPNSLLDVSMRMYLNEINVKTSELWEKQMVLQNVYELHPIGWRPKQNTRQLFPSMKELSTRQHLVLNCRQYTVASITSLVKSSHLSLSSSLTYLCIHIDILSIYHISIYLSYIYIYIYIYISYR